MKSSHVPSLVPRQPVFIALLSLLIFSTAGAFCEERAHEASARTPDKGSPLRHDKRLYVLVQVEPKRPSLEHVLNRINAATGIEVKVALGLETHIPDLGYLSPNPKGYFAWQLMEHLRETDLKEGNWTRTEKGYELTGISAARKASVATTKGSPPPPVLPPVAQVPPRPWWELPATKIVGIIVLVLLALGFMYFRGKRAKP